MSTAGRRRRGWCGEMRGLPAARRGLLCGRRLWPVLLPGTSVAASVAKGVVRLGAELTTAHLAKQPREAGQNDESCVAGNAIAQAVERGSTSGRPPISHPGHLTRCARGAERNPRCGVGLCMLPTDRTVRVALPLMNQALSRRK
jgi:hypothetical protein